MKKTKLVLLTGGTSFEREVSLLSADEIEKSIDTKYDVMRIEVDETSNWVSQLLCFTPDIVFIALHGGNGENGAIQGLLESINIKYIGTKVLGSAICMDKNLAKQIMKSNHIPVAESMLIKIGEAVSENIMVYPLIVKPNKGGSSLGVHKVYNADELKSAIDEIAKYNDDILIEKYIHGNEISCGVIETDSGLEVLTILDINNDGNIFDYNSKYKIPVTKIGLSKLPDYQLVMIEEIAKKAFNILNCHGYCCVDMIVNEEQVYVLEINTLPGMTKNSIIPKIVKEKSITVTDFLNMLIEFEMNAVK